MDNRPSHVLLIPLNSHLLQFYFVPYLSSQQPFYWIYDIIQYLCNISQCFFLLSYIIRYKKNKGVFCYARLSKNKSGMLSGIRHSGDIRKFCTTIIFKISQ